jgi:hypothetical protein
MPFFATEAIQTIWDLRYQSIDCDIIALIVKTVRKLSNCKRNLLLLIFRAAPLLWRLK